MVKESLLNSNLATSEELDEIKKKVDQTIKEALEFAFSSPEPELSEVYTHVHSTPYTVRGRVPGEEYEIS